MKMDVLARTATWAFGGQAGEEHEGLIRSEKMEDNSA